MSLPTPFYDQDGITIFNADAREIVPLLSADALITDPVWPNCEHIWPGIDAHQLLADVLQNADVRTVVVHLGIMSDPRFLTAVPPRFPFIRSCLLEYARPGYMGRVLNNGDMAYVFGEAPASAPGARVLPGRMMASRNDYRMARASWDRGQAGKIEVDDAERPHPTPRRIEHVRWLVNWYGQSSVIDPFMGSGTTARACLDLGKRFIGIEIEERFCQVAVERLSQSVLPLEVA